MYIHQPTMTDFFAVYLVQNRLTTHMISVITMRMRGIRTFPRQPRLFRCRRTDFILILWDWIYFSCIFAVFFIFIASKPLKLVRNVAIIAMVTSTAFFLQMAGFLGRLASSRVLTAALVGGAAVTGVRYYVSSGAEAGTSPGNIIDYPLHDPIVRIS